MRDNVLSRVDAEASTESVPHPTLEDIAAFGVRLLNPTVFFVDDLG